MDKDSIQSIGIITSMLLGVIAIGFNIWQMRMLAKQLELSRRQAIVSTSAAIASRLDDLNQLKFEHPEFSNEMFEEYTPESEASRLGVFSHMRLNLYEQVYIQYNNKLMDDSEFSVWKNYMKWGLRKPYYRGHWQANKGYYGLGFVQVIDEILENEMLNEQNNTNTQLTSGAQ